MSTIFFKQKPRIVGWYSVAGKKEGQGPLRETFSQIVQDEYFGEKTHEMSERKFFITEMSYDTNEASVFDDVKNWAMSILEMSIF